VAVVIGGAPFRVVVAPARAPGHNGIYPQYDHRRYASGG
jgi:hypothetical protein